MSNYDICDIRGLRHLRDQIEILYVPDRFDFSYTFLQSRRGLLRIIHDRTNIKLVHCSTPFCSLLIDCTFKMREFSDCYCWNFENEIIVHRKNIDGFNLRFENSNPIIGCTKEIDRHRLFDTGYQDDSSLILFKMK